MLALVAGSPAAAQQPARPVVGQFGTPFPTRSVSGAGLGTRAAPTAPTPSPAANPGGLPSGYRMVGGTGADAPPPAARQGMPGGGGGKVMYFHKPADTLQSNAPPDAGAVAMAAPQNLPAVAAVPDAPAPTPGLVPPPARGTVADRPIPTPAPIPAPAAAPQDVAAALPLPVAQPKKEDSPVKPPPPEVTQLPPRSSIFLMFDDVQLERVIKESIAKTLKRDVTDPTFIPFPPLPQIVPPGTPYVAKTVQYPPSRAVFEPNFVVHRRQHFEEKNAERQAWDFGIIQPVVSTMYFYKDALLWPNSLATSLVIGPWDTSAGKCLPGSPTPYYLYPPGLTITGTAFEAAVITGAAFIIP